LKGGGANPQKGKTEGDLMIANLFSEQKRLIEKKGLLGKKNKHGAPKKK